MITYKYFIYLFVAVFTLFLFRYLNFIGFIYNGVNSEYSTVQCIVFLNQSKFLGRDIVASFLYTGD